MKIPINDIDNVYDAIGTLIKSTTVEVYQEDVVKELLFQLTCKIVEDGMASYEHGGVIGLSRYIGQIAKTSEAQ